MNAQKENKIWKKKMSRHISVSYLSPQAIPYYFFSKHWRDKTILSMNQKKKHVMGMYREACYRSSFDPLF